MTPRAASLFATVTATLTALGGPLGGIASAHPHGDGAPGQTPAQPPAPAAAAAAAEDDVMAHRFGIGVRATSLQVTSKVDETREFELSGGGLQLRYRFSPHLRLEFTVDSVTSKDEEVLQRESNLVTFGLHYIFNPYDRWNLYLLGGIGATESDVSYRNENQVEVTEKFAEQHVQLGLGLERRFGRLSIGAELRGVGLQRDDEQHDGPRYAGVEGPVPTESSAGQFDLTATYHF